MHAVAKAEISKGEGAWVESSKLVERVRGLPPHARFLRFFDKKYSIFDHFRLNFGSKDMSLAAKTYTKYV